MMKSSTKLFGYCNCAAFNARPGGDEKWFATREDRDAALARKRDAAVALGLSRSAAIAGIYPITRLEAERDALRADHSAITVERLTRDLAAATKRAEEAEATIEAMLREVPANYLEGDGDGPIDAIARLRRAWEARAEECES